MEQDKTSHLVVPINLEALCVGRGDYLRPFAVGGANFSEIPFRRNKNEYVDPAPNVSENLARTPFDGDQPRDAGIHLHWSLPVWLTHGKAQDGDRYRHDTTLGLVEYPAVPNRWLVTRWLGSQRDRAWVVESDYLSKSLLDPGYSVTVPVPPSDTDSQPYRFMGRVFDYHEWKKQKHPIGNEYYAKWAHGQLIDADAYPNKFTALGPGDLTFAAYYPSCSNVFGMYDSARDVEQSPDITYRVIGWYSCASDDPLARYQTLEDFQKEYPAADDADSIRQFQNATHWEFPANIVPGGRTFFVGEIAGVPWDSQRTTTYQRDDAGQIQVAISNTPAEALSAVMATRHERATAVDVDPQKTLEQRFLVEMLFNALQSGMLPEWDRHGGFEKLEYQLQQNSFQAFTGGYLWQVKRKPEPADEGGGAMQEAPLEASDTERQITLPPEAAQDLNQLNVLQQRFDRAWSEIEDLRQLIFADWYKYMLAEYSPQGDHSLGGLGIDAIRLFIESEIDVLKSRIADTGELRFTKDGQLDGTHAPKSGTLAAELIAKLKELDTDLQSAAIEEYRLKIDAQGSGPLAAAGGPDFAKLRQRFKKLCEGSAKAFEFHAVPAPRFWQPNDPTILLVGNNPYLKRHPRQKPAAKLACQVVQAPRPYFDNSGLVQEHILDTVSPILQGAGKRQWCGSNPWIPLSLQWQVDYRPVSELPNEDGYSHDSYSTSYDHHEESLDLQYNHRVSPRGRETYSGSIVLTAHATHNLKNELETYLDDHPPHPEPNLDPQQKADNELHEKLKGLLEKLDRLPSLSQSLGGFNAAMLMRRQTLRLPVHDPLAATAVLDEFTNVKVKQAVGRFNTAAPMMENYYNPLRGGYMSVTRLRLIDAFGQIKAIDTSDVIRAENLYASQPQTGQREKIFLPPRFSQPARLQFRFLSAAHDDLVEMNSHVASSPVCGWVLPNYLDKSLLFYDSDGRYIGYLILSDDGSGKVGWHSAPGTDELEIRAAFETANPHLRNFAIHAYNDGVARGFLTTFFKISNSALDHINPQNHQQHQMLAVLTGRPLALVRASLRLELRGLAAPNQGWKSLANDIAKWNNRSADIAAGKPPQRESKGFLGVKIPVRLGDTLNINDGLIGYFKEDAPGGGTNYHVFYSPMHDRSDRGSSGISHPAFNTIQLTADPDAQPTRVTMLMDPTAMVHATTSVLPVKSLEIPPDQYVKALQAMQVSFVTGPLLVDPAKLAFPVPTESEGQWRWLQKQGMHAWGEPRQIGTIDDRAALDHGHLALVEGWLNLLNKGR